MTPALFLVIMFLAIAANPTTQTIPIHDPAAESIKQRLFQRSPEQLATIETVLAMKPERNGVPSAVTLREAVDDTSQGNRIGSIIGWEAVSKENGKWKILLHYRDAQGKLIQAEWHYDPEKQRLYPFERLSAPRFWRAGQVSQSFLRAQRLDPVPEATLPCSLEEAKWWDQIRKTCQQIRRNSNPNNDDLRTLNELIREGAAKSYRAPILDQRVIQLYAPPPRYTEEARTSRINGSVKLRVEFLADGTIGKVEVTRGLDPGLDQRSIESARSIVFLPAVQDGLFVKHVTVAETTFNLR